MMLKYIIRSVTIAQRLAVHRIAVIQAYGFNTQIEKPNQVKAKLLKVVEKEAKYEVENYQEDETVNEYLNKVGFVLTESDGDNNIELNRQVGDANVKITFQSRSPNQEEGNQEQPEKVEGEEPQDEYQDYSDFTVYVQKADGKALCYECSSVQSEIQVNLVSVVNDIVSHQKVPRFERGINSYGGPEFQTLDERLQTSLVQYLKSYGVDEELAAFVEHYSLDKEQRLYMAWLKQLETFLKN